LNILFFPGQYFSAGLGKQNCSPGQFSFHDTNTVENCGKMTFLQVIWPGQANYK
jgi:hypothetical protein